LPPGGDRFVFARAGGAKAFRLGCAVLRMVLRAPGRPSCPRGNRAAFFWSKGLGAGFQGG